MAKIKPGTPHPTKRGMVMGKNGRYVAKSTYNKQVKAAQSKPARQNVTGQKALPPAGQSGGSKPPKGTKQPGTTRNQPGNRRSAAASKKAGASAGSRGTGVRTAGGSPTRVGGSAGAGLASGVGLEIASKMAQTIGKPGQSRMSRLGVQGPAKPKVKAKPKAKSSQSTKSGMTAAQLKAAQDKANKARKGGKMSNIPASKAAPTRKNVTSKPQTVKQRAYAADARNREYDKLRKAGKTKEAEKLGRQIAADARKKAPKNPYRAPQGSERKDRLSKQVKELKGMGKKKKKQSRANQAGWQGNRNY